jgi:DNA-binding protein
MAEEKQKKKSRGKPKTNANRAVRADDNTVFVGQKPVMNYVIACLTCFNSGGSKVIVKARGQAISKAVDTVELLRRAFVKNLQVNEINIGTEEVPRVEGQLAKVSSLEITVAKP